MYGYVYMTQNKVNNKRYIGQRVGEFDKNYHGSGKVIKQAIKKYGEESFDTVLLEVANSKEELDSLEKKYIEKFNALYRDDFYNIHEGGTGGNTKAGYSYEEYQELISKMSNSKKGKKIKFQCKDSMKDKHQDYDQFVKSSISNRRKGNDDRDRYFRDIVMNSSDSEILKKAFSRQNGAANPSSVTYKLTDVETGKEILIGTKTDLSKFLGVTYKRLNRIIKDGFYKPYSIKELGKTKDVAYISSYSIRRLDNIVRYNNRMKNHTQTVAAHSYYVTYTMMRLLELIDLPIDIKYKLMSYCLVHDIAEVHVGDMPHDVKAAHPILKNLLEEFEEEFYIHAGLSGINNIIKDDYQKIKYNLFKLCDLLDVVSYSKEELYLGNLTLEMSNILAQAIEDCSTIVRALQFYKVLPKNFNFIKFLDDIYEVKVISIPDNRSYDYTTKEIVEHKEEG